MPTDHPDKGKEGGSQSTPGEFIDWLLDVAEACNRVLAPHGSLCIELGDTYSGSGGGGGDYSEGGLREGQPGFTGSEAASRDALKAANAAHWRQKNSNVSAWPLAKSLSLIPESFRWAMVYGRNPFTGRTTEPWRLRNVIRWVRPNPPVGALCVDAETEALTLDGWKTHDQLSDGDLVAAYDLKTDSVRFLPAKFTRYEVEGESMVAIEKRSTSQRLTEWHRCLVRTRKGGVQVKLAQDLTNECQTLLCAPFEDIPGPAPVTVERAALLGWFVTEGSPHARQVRIVQSQTANPQNVVEIRRLLEVDGADFTESVYRHRYNDSDIVTFTIKGALADWLALHHKRLPMSYVTTWPQAQAEALFYALMDGDGHWRKSGGVLFHQQDEAVTDAVQVLAIRLGYRASKSFQPSLNLWQVTMSKAPIQDRRWTKIRKWDREGVPREVYTGTVWCPQVETGFWLARRKGKTLITGNSDKFRPATSELMVFCKSAKRYFDLDSVRTPFVAGENGGGSGYTDDRIDPRGGRSRIPDRMMTHSGAPPLDWWNIPLLEGEEETRYGPKERPITGGPGGAASKAGVVGQGVRLPVRKVTHEGAPPLDWWEIPPGGYQGSHYAVFPPELCVKPVKAMCPEKVCRVCGEPSRRIVGEAEYVKPDGRAHTFHGDGFDEKLDREGRRQVQKSGADIPNRRIVTGYDNGNMTRVAPTLGFSDCGHDDWRPGMVLDPFVGSGTTLMVATGHGRDAIGIDLDSRNFDLALERVGPFILSLGETEARPS